METASGEKEQEEMETPNTPSQDDSKGEAAVAATKDVENAAAEKEAQASDEEDDIEYPHGVKLAIILAALCLAVFLVALDQTSRCSQSKFLCPHSLQTRSWDSRSMFRALLFLDRRIVALILSQLLQLPFQGSLITSTVSRILVGMEVVIFSRQLLFNLALEGYIPFSA